MEISGVELYKKWYQNAVADTTALKNKSRLLSWSRLIIFIALIASSIAGLSSSGFFLWAAAVFLVAFIYLLVYHDKIQESIKYHENLSAVLQDELSAHNHEYKFAAGDRYTDPTHPYTYDLDVFGKDSLFSSLNRTATSHGSDKLANMFIDPLLQEDKITGNQQAIAELAGKHMWLLKYRTYGIMGNRSETSEEELLNWISATPLFRSKIFTLLLWIIPVISVGMSVLVGTGAISISLFMLYFALPLSVSGIYAAAISRRHMQVSRKASMLTNYGRRLKMLEKEEFHSKVMLGIQHSIVNKNKPASHAINQLSGIITSMDARLNWLMWIILNFLLIWDIRQMRRLEDWQRNHHDDLNRWFNTLAETEALGSLAGYYILNPSFIFPKPVNDRLKVNAVDAGHPLIPENRNIKNTISIKGSGTFNIITGANMAGKSTYLRTTGVNLVLAMTGAPVCAREFVFYPAVLYTSLHTVDSLSNNKSYFFAELERLKLIIDTLNKGETVYVFLDEILKGTNSHDKQYGSKALLKQLVTLGTAGMIATHDLDLGLLEQSFPDNISNYSFEAVINESELMFDYKLKPGIARNMNATFLMKQMGITL